MVVVTNAVKGQAWGSGTGNATAPRKVQAYRWRANRDLTATPIRTQRHIIASYSLYGMSGIFQELGCKIRFPDNTVLRSDSSPQGSP